MSLLPNRFPIPQLPGKPWIQDLLRVLVDFIQAVCNTFRHLNNDNIEDGLNLVTDAELEALSGVAVWVTDGSSSLLRKGMPVYFSGPKTITLADASSEATRARAFCTLTNGTNALIKSTDLISNVPIESGITVTDGQTLWLSSTAGYVTSTIPTSGLKQSVGVAADNGTAAGGTCTVAAAINVKGIRPF